MRIRTILAAAAAPAIAAAALLATTGAASAAVQPSAPSAYFWQPNGHALTGPQDMPGGTVSLTPGSYLAKVTADEHNANLTGSVKTITVTGTLTGGSFADQPNGGESSTPAGQPNMRLYFEGGSAGTNSNSPDGYMGQQWWSDASLTDLGTVAGHPTFQVTVTTDPANWSGYNGEPASDPANLAMFTAALSHVRDLGLSFGGGYFAENGVTGAATLTVSSINVTP
jgi:hypothetical protein